MKAQRYPVSLLKIPADLLADPDGDWSYEALVRAAGLDPDAQPPPVVAALSEPWRGHPDGAAVVASTCGSWVSIVECQAMEPRGSVSHAA